MRTVQFYQMTLEQFITDPETGKRKRGAITRVAEHLGISRPWIEKYLSGEWMPTVTTLRRINDMIAARIPLDARHKGRSGKRKRIRRNRSEETKLSAK